jgi:hypothetical protein
MVGPKDDSAPRPGKRPAGPGGPLRTRPAAGLGEPPEQYCYTGRSAADIAPSARGPAAAAVSPDGEGQAGGSLEGGLP